VSLRAAACAVALAALAFAAPAAAKVPRVALTPAAGPPGSTVVLTGAGFPARSAPAVRRGARRIGRARASRRGRFRIALKIPAKARPGPLAFRVGRAGRLRTAFRVGGAPGSAGASASGGARLRWGPLAGPPGTRVRLAVHGLRRRALARVSVRGESRRVRAGRRGRLALSVKVRRGAGRRAGVIRARGVRLPFSFRVTRSSAPPAPPSPGAPGRQAAEPRLPVRAFFYYPWFPETWGKLHDHTRYHPSLGFYDSSSPELIRSHLRALEYGHAEVAISSWWKRGDRPDTRLTTLLDQTAAAGSPIRWAVYYEAEAYGNPSPDEIRSDLTYLRDRFAGHPAFFRLNGRFVVFVYADASDGCSMADRWKQANTVGAHVVLKLFHGFKSCASQPDGWHQYSASPETSHGSDSFTVSPGFWKWDEASPRGARDVARFRQNVSHMAASGANYQLVISFNEWGEGTAVESAQEWASPSGYGAYLDALHDVPGPG
jgi:hypothetical protein